MTPAPSAPMQDSPTIQAIISDLDGTILPRGGRISAETLHAFRQAGRNGCVRIIATGRNLRSALEILPPDFPVDFLVFSSGAGILGWTDRRLLSARHLEQKECRAIARHLWDYGVNFTIQREIPDNHLFYYTSIYPLHEDYTRRLALHASFGTPISSPSDIRGKATQFVLILDALQLRLMERIRRELPACSVIRTTSPIDNRAIWMEIFSSGVNKGTACRELIDRLHIPASACAGIGNDYNDVDFLNLCGRAVLVANAPLPLRAHYKSVASDRNDGFAEFVSGILPPAS